MASLQLQIHNLITDPVFCAQVGFVSSVVGLVCYALSSSFKHLFGEWNSWKIFLYILLSFIISSIMLFAKKWNLSKSFLLKAHAGFLVFMLTSVYSYFYDKAVNGKPDMLSLISCGAFALMSLCMSRQINLGFEVDLLNYFLGSLTIYLMKINLMLAFVGAAFSYAFIILRSSLESQPGTETITACDQIALDIDNINREEREADATSCLTSDYSNHPQELQLLHRRNMEVENDGISAPGSSKTVENLTDQAQLLEVELKRTTEQPQEVKAIAGEETVKYKAADQRIKSPTDQLKILSCKAEVQEVELERTTKQLKLQGSLIQFLSNCSSTIRKRRAGHKKQSQSPERTTKQLNFQGSLIQLLSNGSSAIRKRRAGHKKQSQSPFQKNNKKQSQSDSTNRNGEESVEICERGVYVTLTALPGGATDIKEVHFSGRVFTEEQAQQWWADNRERVYELYNVRKIDKSTVGVGNGSEDDKGQEFMSNIGSEKGECLVVGESLQLQYTGYEASISSRSSFGSSISEEGLRARGVKQQEEREPGMQSSRVA